MSVISAGDCFDGALTARVRPAAVFLCPGEVLRRHGGKPRRQDLERYPGGKLKYPDLGIPPTAAMMQQRQRVVGERDCWNEKASTLIGQAFLLGLLADPELGRSDRGMRQARARYDALDDFVKLHRAVWGIRTAQSVLKNAVAGDRSTGGADPADNTGARRRLARMVGRVLLIAVPQGIPSPLHVMQRVAFDEVLNDAGQPDARRLSPAACQALRLAADAILNARGRGQEREPVAKAPRPRGLEVRFDRAEGPSPDDEQLLAALERLRTRARSAGPG